MPLASYIEYLHDSETNLAKAMRECAEGHAGDVDVYHICNTLASQCEDHARKLAPFAEKYRGRDTKGEEPEDLRREAFGGVRGGGMGLLRDLQDLYVMASSCDISWTVLGQAAQGVGDRELHGAVLRCEDETTRQVKWFRTRMKQAAPQALIVA